DGARSIAALSIAGFTKEARALAEGLLLFQWPMGAFLSQRGQLDGTGQALWVMEQALLRPVAGPEVRRIAPAVEGARHWLDQQRDMGRRLGGPYATMLPFAEPRDG